MRYAILGGDLRFVHLRQMLSESGRQTTAFLQELAGGERPALKELGKYSCIISNWPMKWPLSDAETTQEEILSYIAPGSMLLLCGPKFPQRRRWDLQYVNLWQDGALLRGNAWLTAQAAVAAALQHTGRSMENLPCMVVGCGRIGSALMEILLNLGARVTVVSGSEGKRRRIRDGGAEAVDLKDMQAALPAQRLVFSTPPAMVLDYSALKHAAADAYIIDLASPPYGVDLQAAQQLGIAAVREPGLPGRHSPRAAARALHSAIIRWEEEQEYV